jgi:hypothetical protein
MVAALGEDSNRRWLRDMMGPGSRISSENMKIIINNAGYEADS